MSATKETLPASNIILRQPTGSPIPHILLYVVQVVALASPSFHGRRFLFSNAIVILALLSMINPHFTNNVALAQPCTVGWSYYLSTLEKMLFSGAGGPEGTLWHRDRPPKEALAFRGFGFQKLKWATALIVNTRGIRWNFQIKNVPKRGNTTKFKFVVSQAIAFVRFLFMTDLVCQLGIHLFYTAPDGQVGTLDSKYLTLCDRFWIWSFAKPVVFGATPYFMLNLQHITFSIAAVLLGLSKPEDWPPMFGFIKDVTTLREFWGRYWHQTIRKMLTAYTSAFVDAMKIKRGTKLSSYTQLWLAFTISGAMHASSMLILPSPTNITFNERTVGVMQFFFFQAAAITFEDFIQWVWKQLGGKTSAPSMFRTLVGYTWVICCFWYSLPLIGDVMLRMRMGDQTFLPFTVTGPWMRYIPIP